MINDILEGLKASEISPVLLSLNTTRMMETLADCEAAGKFAAEFKALSDNSTTALPVRSLALFLKSSMDIDLTNVTLGQLGDWLAWIINPSVEDYLNSDGDYVPATPGFLYDIQSQCLRAFCHNIEWAGDPDLSGVGVSSSPFPEKCYKPHSE